MATLTVLDPQGKPLTHAVSRSPFVIGREPGCDLVLDHAFVSRRQVVLQASEGRWAARAVGRNPVRLDGAALDGLRPLEDGSKIVIGPLTLVFGVGIDAGESQDEAPRTLELSRAELLSLDGSAAARHLTQLGALSATLADAKDAGEAAQLAANALVHALEATAAHVEDERAALASLGTPHRALERALVERAGRGDGALLVDRDVGGRPLLVARLGPPAVGVLAVERAPDGADFAREDARFASVLAYMLGAAIGAAKRVESLAQDRARLAVAQRVLERDISRRGRFGEIVGESASMARLVAAIRKVAASEASVLVHGETGAGKELVAREIHANSPRRGGPFLALNSAALPEGLVESELFGHKKGAFSGADADRRGVFESARGGTVFLDEIGELPLAAQAKLLRVLDRREITPLGGGMPVQVDVRIIAATHRDLERDVAAQRFRQDLLFRLKVFTIVVPPLRDRLEDLPILIDHLFRSSPEAKRKRLAPPTPRFVEALSRHRFPGNVRELAHLVEHAAILADEGEALDVDHLAYELAAPPVSESVGSGAAPEELSLRDAVAAFERSFILKSLERDGWNRTKTARRLGISLRAFMDKLVRFDLKGPR